MTHYWPICNGLMKDAKGSADMIQGSLTSFVPDRFGNADSALALNGGWTQVPSGIYFDSPQFTITVWIFPQNVGRWSRVIDFGNGPSGDNILLTIDCGDNLLSGLGLYSGSNFITQPNSGQALTLNTWQFLVVTFNGTNVYFYINGALVGTSSNTFLDLLSINRTKNYIGKSNWAGNGFSSSYIDELRFYRISLTQIQINTLMNQSDTSSTLNSCKVTTTSTTSTTSTHIITSPPSSTSQLTSSISSNNLI